MKIIILGAGQVGASVAEGLISEGNDITVVDTDGARLARLQNTFDLRTLTGNGAWPSVLAEAGAADADMLIAVTSSDQTNLVVCKIAKQLFNLPTRIARLRASDYLKNEELLSDENFAVDFALCPENVVTQYITKLIEYPGALQVLDFGHERAVMVAMRACIDGKLIGRPIKEMGTHLSNGVDARIAALFRRDRPILPTGDTLIQEGDEVFVLAAQEHMHTVMLEMRGELPPVRRIMLAGGGNIGLRVAQQLGSDYQVKLLEMDESRCEHVANLLPSTLVLHGDATDETILLQEGIDSMDLFIALTNVDEDNIMAASLAKRLGCKRVVALINRKIYAELVQGGPIDIAISPALVSIGTLLTHVRRGDVARVHSLRRGAAEALEIVAHGDEKTSKVIGRKIADIQPIAGAYIGAIIRQTPETTGGKSKTAHSRVIIAHKEIVIEPNDHVIIFCQNRKVIQKVERLFAVAVGFF